MEFSNKKNFMEDIEYMIEDNSEVEAQCSEYGCNSCDDYYDSCNDYYDDCNDDCNNSNDCCEDNCEDSCNDEYCGNDYDDCYDNDWDNCYDDGCNNSCNNGWDNCCNDNWSSCNNNCSNTCDDDCCGSNSCGCNTNHCHNKKCYKKKRKCGFMFNFGFCRNSKRKCCNRSSKVCNSADVCLDDCDNEVRANIKLNYKNSTKICCRVVDCNNRGVGCATVKVLKETCNGWECIATSTTDCNGCCEINVTRGCSLRKCRIIAEKECTRGIKVVNSRINCGCC